MKQTDIDRLKEKLGDEFELVTQSPDENDRFFVVIAKKKDPWEGVEFVECVKSSVTRFTECKIYKVNPNGKGVDKCDFLLDNDHHPNGFVGVNRNAFKPSTEAAYVSQLKEKAFELYGKIKEGDEFDRTSINPNWDVIEMEKRPFGGFDFQYEKANDTLYFGKYAIYSKGKWAKKVERFKVDSNGGSINSQAFYFRWGQKETEKMQDIGFVELCDYLAKCLEEKLNEAGT